MILINRYIKTNMSETPTALPYEYDTVQYDIGDTHVAPYDPAIELSSMLKDAGFEGLSAEQRLGVIERATLDDYKNAIDAIHRKVAPDDSPEPNPVRGYRNNRVTGEFTGWFVAPEDRDGVLSYALDQAKAVCAKYRTEGGDIDEALQRCGNLAAFGVVLAHTYTDGNGRTSRVLGELIHKGYNQADPLNVEALQVLSANRQSKADVYMKLAYTPSIKWKDGAADANPTGFLDDVAALDMPVDGSTYRTGSIEKFRTPRM